MRQSSTARVVARRDLQRQPRTKGLKYHVLFTIIFVMWAMVVMKESTRKRMAAAGAGL